MVGVHNLYKIFLLLILHFSETVEMLLPETEMSPNKDWEGDILINIIVSLCCLNYQHILIT